MNKLNLGIIIVYHNKCSRDIIRVSGTVCHGKYVFRSWVVIVSDIHQSRGSHLSSVSLPLNGDHLQSGPVYLTVNDCSPLAVSPFGLVRLITILHLAVCAINS